MGTRTLMTTEEYAQMHTSEREDYELVDGELIPLPSAEPIHNKIRRKLDRLIEDYFVRNPIGELYDEIDCDIAANVRRPDLSVFLNSELHQIDVKKTPIPFAPDIAVAVLSPSEIAIKLNRKVREYLSAGSKEVWILDHENGEVFVHTSTAIRKLAGDSLMESPLLPGFSARAKNLVAGL